MEDELMRKVEGEMRNDDRDYGFRITDSKIQSGFFSVSPIYLLTTLATSSFWIRRIAFIIRRAFAGMGDVGLWNAPACPTLPGTRKGI